MGQKHPQAAQGGPIKPNFTPDVEVIKQKVFEPHYGEVKLVRDKNTQEVMILKEVIVNTKQSFDNEIAFYTQRVDLTHPNVVRVLGFSTEDKHNFCSTYYKISLFIEVLDRDLSKELEARIGNRVAYTEQEILYIADNLISGLSYFQSQGVPHGDIRPLNIFIDERNCKLSDPFLSAQKGSNGLTAAIIQGAKSHLSPQLLAQVPESKFEITVDQFRADVYSLGATLLALATLTNSEDLYDYKLGQINKPLLEERLEIVRYNYSQFTYELIRSMLTEDDVSRPDFVELSNRLLPYSEQIRGAAVHFSQTVTGGYEYEGQRQEVEQVKSSGAPAGGQYVDADDLEARIQAALARTRATFEQVALKDKLYYGSEAEAQHHYENAPYIPGNFNTPSYANLAAGNEAQGERVVRSAAPPESTERTHVAVSDVVNTHENVLKSSQAGLKSSQTVQAQASQPNYTQYIQPLVEQYTSTNYGTTGTTGLSGADTGLRKSAQYEKAGTQDPNAYVPTYVPSTSYNYTSTYGTTSYDKPLDNSLKNSNVAAGTTSGQYTSNYGYTAGTGAEKPLKSSNVAAETTATPGYTATYTSNYGAPTTTYEYSSTTTGTGGYQPIDLSKYGITGTGTTGTTGATYSYTSTYVPTTTYTATYTTNYGTTGQAGGNVAVGESVNEVVTGEHTA